MLCCSKRKEIFYNDYNKCFKLGNTLESWDVRMFSFHFLKSFGYALIDDNLIKETKQLWNTLPNNKGEDWFKELINWL